MEQLENIILKNLIYNEEYARKVLPFLSPEYFIDRVEKKPNKLLNYLFYKIFVFEGSFLNKINYPFGISIIFLGKKK